VTASSRLPALFEDYAAYHRHPMNKLCHYLGIPLIVFTLVGILGQHSLGVTLGVAAAALAYQARLSPMLTLLFAFFVGASVLTAPRLDARVLWAGFVSGWALQFLGHYGFEKRSPAFFKNLQQLLVGPIWILGTLTGTPSSPREALDTPQPGGSARTR
jgi:uncharacterized membrane protein YGL010W